jgi:hypothetical protein
MYNQIQMSIVSKKLDSILMKSSLMVMYLCLENNDDGDGGYDRQIVADILNIDQPTTFQSYATIVDNVVVSGLL